MACGSSGSSTEAPDAGLRGDASVDAGARDPRIDPPAPYEPACLLDPPTYLPPTPLPSLPVAPKVLWTKPNAVENRPFQPVLATASAIVVAARPYLYFFDHGGTLKFKKSWPGSSVILSMVSDADGNIYAASQSIVRIAPDGTESEYTPASHPNITAGLETTYLTAIALDPLGTLHAVGSDGYLHGVQMRATETIPTYDVQFATARELLNRPTLFGVGGTLVVNDTLFDPASGARVGPDRAYEDRGTSFVTGRGHRLVRPRSSVVSTWDLVDQCGKVVRRIPSFGDNSFPWFGTFNDGILWEAANAGAPSSFDVEVNAVDASANPAGRWQHIRGISMLVGADGTYVRYGMENGTRKLIGTNDSCETRWELVFPGVPSAYGTVLDNGVLYMIDDVNLALVAVQTPVPGLAALPRAQFAGTAAFPPRNWVGDK
jgi:hypothetical protein